MLALLAARTQAADPAFSKVAPDFDLPRWQTGDRIWLRDLAGQIVVLEPGRADLTGVAARGIPILSTAKPQSRIRHRKHVDWFREEFRR